jgi:hypothetical protein
VAAPRLPEMCLLRAVRPYLPPNDIPNRVRCGLASFRDGEAANIGRLHRGFLRV